MLTEAYKTPFFGREIFKAIKMHIDSLERNLEHFVENSNWAMDLAYLLGPSKFKFDTKYAIHGCKNETTVDTTRIKIRMYWTITWQPTVCVQQNNWPIWT